MRPARLAWTAAIIGLILAPFLIAAMASRASIPGHTDRAAHGIPRLPHGSTEGDLFRRLRPLPLLVTALPDQASRDAVEAFENAGILDPASVEGAFFAAWDALAVDESFRPTLLGLGVTYVDPTQAPKALPNALRAELVADPDNADRLVNASAMLFARGMLFDSGLAQMPQNNGDWYFGQGSLLELRAQQLLAAVGDWFGPSPTQLLDQAFVESMSGSNERSVDLAAQAVALDEDNVTARLVLADLQARLYDDAAGWRRALATLAPLIDDPGTETLGRAAEGDAQLTAASLRSYETPRTARVLARRALDAYDLVLARVADPGVYAGRARALALLGELDAARESMARAVELAPKSVDLRIGAATLAEADGDAEAMREAALQAFDLTNHGWDPGIATVRFVPGVKLAHPGDLGLFGASIGSTLDHVGTYRITEGAGLIFDMQVVPRVIDPDLDLWRRSGFAPDVATLTALQATESLRDWNTADDYVAVWRGQAIHTSRELTDDSASKLQLAEWAGELTATGQIPAAAVANGSSNDVVAEAEKTQRRAGRFGYLAGLCAGLFTPRNWHEVNSDIVDAAVDRLRCAGDAQMLQDDPKSASRTYSEALRIDEAGSHIGRGELLVRRGASRLATAPGDRQGRTDLQQVAAVSFSEDQRVLALIVLAADDLQSGDVAVARAHYDLAIAILNSDEMFTSDEGGRAQIRQALVTALTNRGVATLRLAQDDPQQPPQCVEAEHREACDRAAADFQAALEIDPLNPITLMDAGWVARSLGDIARARELLGEATAADPSLFPAFNDLGVLAARAGDRQGARDALDAAVAVSPMYALGWWNLGVLELDSGLAGTIAGQAALARAIELDSSLAGRPADFRTDEAVYRATFAGLEEISNGWPVTRTYALAATVLGAIGLTTAFGRLARSAIGELWPTLARRVATSRILALRFSRLTARVQELRSHVPQWLIPWTPWVLTAAALGVVTTLTVWLREPTALIATLFLVLLATGSALAVHEAAHMLTLWRYGGRLMPAQWGAGALLALLLVPVQASSGPYFGERFEGVPEQRLVRIRMAGPLANLLLAVVAFGAYLLYPAPILLLTSQVNLAVCAYSLLPNLPLDGELLVGRRPLLAALFGIVVTATGAAFVVGTG
jgi:tetratricopeptide (TPR) repeat protein